MKLIKHHTYNQPYYELVELLPEDLSYKPWSFPHPKQWESDDPHTVCGQCSATLRPEVLIALSQHLRLSPKELLIALGLSRRVDKFYTASVPENDHLFSRLSPVTLSRSLEVSYQGLKSEEARRARWQERLLELTQQVEEAFGESGKTADEMCPTRLANLLFDEITACLIDRKEVVIESHRRWLRGGSLLMQIEDNAEEEVLLQLAQLRELETSFEEMKAQYEKKIEEARQRLNVEALRQLHETAWTREGKPVSQDIRHELEHLLKRGEGFTHASLFTRHNPMFG